MERIQITSIRFAATLMLVLLSCLVVFHLLILSGTIPYNIVWGGRLESASQMHWFEGVSITVNLAAIAIVGMKAGYIKSYISEKMVNILLLTLAMLFALNTVGNVFSTTDLEKILFTPLTLISAALCYKMAMTR